jgi:hypothetical protein
VAAARDLITLPCFCTAADPAAVVQHKHNTYILLKMPTCSPRCHGFVSPTHSADDQDSRLAVHNAKAALLPPKACPAL